MLRQITEMPPGQYEHRDRFYVVRDGALIERGISAPAPGNG